MCFMAGANAVFTGEQMLTTPCEYIRKLVIVITMFISYVLYPGSPWDEVG